ncbi:MAG: recombinase family protein, partial [Anaerolineae bacterium]|nr:recombinase family protein [Anaerolineae bacterium]
MPPGGGSSHARPSSGAGLALTVGDHTCGFSWRVCPLSHPCILVSTWSTLSSRSSCATVRKIYVTQEVFLMRAVCYLRYSCTEQADGFSLDAQRHSTHTFIQQRGWTLVREYVDEAHSAKANAP